MKTEKNILIAFLLNIFFSIMELFGGIFTNSIAIISDSIHDFGDAISIGISYILEKISKGKPNLKYTYGYTRYSVVGSLITTLILFTGSIFVIYGAIKRIINPVDVNYDGMIIVAIIGVIINYLAAYFTKGVKSLNQKAVNLHMLEDVLGWIVVLIGSILMKFTNINIIDSVMSILVAIFIIVSSIKNLIDILNIFLEKVPVSIDVEQIKESLMKVNNIKEIHHIHVWGIDECSNCATMHIICDINNFEKIKKEVKGILKKFEIDHVTIEFENILENCEDKECDTHIETLHH